LSTQRRGVALTPMETRYDIILRTARLADELGYEAFALPEGWGLDATLLLTEAASRTRRIKLVSGILSVWGRTPGTLAMTAATLDRLSGGRFVLGLGPSTRALVEGFHDVRFAHPADKLREVTIKVRALLAGERALLDATPGSRPLRLGQPAAPIYPSGSRRWATAPSGSPPSWPTAGSPCSSPMTRSSTGLIPSGRTGRWPVSGPSRSPSSPAR
jgi:alkanesulfonate monooxygenase SsuD/methylene tetrahydromethanopterin reductase-like flavin-dependent oxidoreductase (luciferase family)